MGTMRNRGCLGPRQAEKGLDVPSREERTASKPYGEGQILGDVIPYLLISVTGGLSDLEEQDKDQWGEVTGKHKQLQEQAVTKWNAGVAGVEGGESLEGSQQGWRC